MLAEYSTIVEPPSTAKASYLTTDHLGSPRILTDAKGNVISRRDFHPFGEEIYTPQRTAWLNYTADTVRKQFTGYERDDESSLGYAIKRYYNGGHGRFSSVDPYNIIFEMEKGRDAEEKQKIFIGYISQPQIWNKYVYSINNPLNMTDPDGRRPLTRLEIDNLKKFVQSGMDYAAEKLKNGEMTVQQAAAFQSAVIAAANVIQNAILAVPNDAEEDPKNLRAVLYAMGQIGDPNNVAKWSSGGTVGFNSNGANVTLGAGSNKCTIFVGIAYAKGANIGWRNNGNNGGYQVNWATFSGRVYTPVTYDLAWYGAANFVQTNTPQLGDIAVGAGTANTFLGVPTSYNQGHAGIYIFGEVVISANPDRGIRVGRFSPTSDPNSGFRYLTYKP
jgi:RHS repeat-associated protein